MHTLHMHTQIYTAVCVSAIQILNQVNDCHKTWYERYSIASYPKLVLFNFL
jgi:hypothetical protein